MCSLDFVYTLGCLYQDYGLVLYNTCSCYTVNRFILLPCFPTPQHNAMEDADKLAKALVCNFLKGEDKKLAITVGKKLSAVSMSDIDRLIVFNYDRNWVLARWRGMAITTYTSTREPQANKTYIYFMYN